MVLVKVCQWVHINKKFSKYEEKQHMDDNQILDKIAPLNKTRLVGGFFFFFFFLMTKLPSLLTHFSPFHFLFPTKFYFTNILLSTFFRFTNIKLNFFPFTNIKEKKGWRNVNEGLRNKLNKVLLFFLLLKILSILTHTHIGRWEKVLKKLTVVYIQKGLTLGYTAHVLNFFNSHLFFIVVLTHCFFF